MNHTQQASHLCGHTSHLVDHATYGALDGRAGSQPWMIGCRFTTLSASLLAFMVEKKWCLVLLGRKEWQRKKYYPPSEKGTWNYVELRLLICFNPFRWCLVIVFSIESFVVEKIEKASHMSAESQCWIWSRVLVLHFGIHVAAVSERCQRRWIPKITRNQTTVTTALKKGTWLAMSHTCASTL